MWHGMEGERTEKHTSAQESTGEDTQRTDDEHDGCDDHQRRYGLVNQPREDELPTNGADTASGRQDAHRRRAEVSGERFRGQTVQLPRIATPQV
jgi:hypothetical protein